MLWLHPVIQLLATMMAFYVLFLAWQKVKILHLGQKGKFEWRKHVFWGRIIIIVWFGGLVLGRVAVHSHWDMSPLFLTHSQGAMIMVPFMLIAYVTGSVMDRKRQKRFWLPVVHGVNNIIMLGLALYQFYTGYFIVVNFIL